MEITLFGAFVAGLLSFLAPCVLPIVPGYLSYITGVSAQGEEQSVKKSVIPVLFFVLGFSSVFISLGAGASMIGQVLTDYRELIAKIGGGVIVFFGLHFSNLMLKENFGKLLAGTGLISISLYLFGAIGEETAKTLIGVIAVVGALYLLDLHIFLYKQMKKQGEAKAGALSSFVIGLTFGAGWSPCIGPVLGTILLIASQQESVIEGIKLLSLYSLGLGVPFILAGIFWSTFISFVRGFSKFFTAIEYLGGAVLIVMGILVATGQLAIISSALE